MSSWPNYIWSLLTASTPMTSQTVQNKATEAAHISRQVTYEIWYTFSFIKNEQGIKKITSHRIIKPVKQQPICAPHLSCTPRYHHISHRYSGWLISVWVWKGYSLIPFLSERMRNISCSFCTSTHKIEHLWWFREFSASCHPSDIVPLISGICYSRDWHILAA